MEKNQQETEATKGRIKMDDLQSKDEQVKDLSGDEQRQVTGGRRPASIASNGEDGGENSAY